MVKPLKLSMLKSQLECTMNNVGASDNPRKLKREMKHTGHTNIPETQLKAIQVFNDWTPIDIKASLSSRMLLYFDIARRQTLLLISGSVKEQAHRRSHTCNSENQDERNDRNQESWRQGDRSATHTDKRHAIKQKEGSHATYSQAEYMIYHSCPHKSYDESMMDNDTNIMLKDNQDNIQARGNNTASQTMYNSESMQC